MDINGLIGAVIRGYKNKIPELVVAGIFVIASKTIVPLIYTLMYNL